MKIGSENSLFIADQLSRIQSAIARSLQRLSTGLRVNSPQDDVGAFSESVNLQSRIHGYNQALLNINDSLGMMNTASSALSTQIEIVQKIRELAVQASNGTLTTTDRTNLNTEVQQLLQEFERITSTTNFNGLNLLDGSNSTPSIQIGAAAGDTASLQLNSTNANCTFVYASHTQTSGTGTFQNPTTTTFTTAGFFNTFQVTGDFNGDGNQDVLFNSNNSLIFVQGNGNGTFRPAQTIGSATDGPIVAADVNGDGKLDIVHRNGTTVSVYLGNGDGTFGAATNFTVGASTNGLGPIQVGDINNDGKLDIVSSDNTDGTISILLGNGNGTFQARSTIAAPNTNQVLSFLLADLDGDGNKDIVINPLFSANYSIYWGNGNGTFSAAQNISNNGYGTYGMQAGDFNGDGKPDLILGDIVHSTIALNLGGRSFAAPTLLDWTTYDGLPNFVISDVNGDGNQDVVYTGKGYMGISLGNGNGTFAPSATYAYDDSANAYRQLVVADFNGDGAPDVISSEDNFTYFDYFQQNYSTHTVAPWNAGMSALSQVNVSTQSAASNLLIILDNVLTELKTNQANIAAVQTRFGSTFNYDQLMSQNLSDANSNLTSVDIAAETSNLVRYQILEQAGVAALSQANVNAQIVLKLLNQ